jgi:hypothetical protein
MLILLTILLLTAAASAYFYFSIRRNNERELSFGRSEYIPDAPQLRPLFEPTNDEVEAERRLAEKKQEADEAHEFEEVERARKREFYVLLNAWRSNPNRSDIVNLFELARADGEMYADTAEAVAKEFHNNKIEGLSAADLVQLLESHFWLVPIEKRTPGVSYRFQTVLSSLRSTSVVQ